MPEYILKNITIGIGKWIAKNHFGDLLTCFALQMPKGMFTRKTNNATIATFIVIPKVKID